MTTLLITGSSRGIGLELVKQLLDSPPSEISKVFALTRSSPPAGLQRLLDSFPHRLTNIVVENISDPSLVNRAAKEVEVALEGAGLDILVNNAGTAVENPNGICTMTNRELLDIMDANVGSAHCMAATFIPLLRKGQQKKVVNISSALGSISRHREYQWASTYSYKLSKAAMNMLTVQYALEFENEGIVFTALSPGWIKTDMGGDGADIDLETGVRAVKQAVLKSCRADSGKFVCIRVPGWEEHKGTNQYDGGELPW